MKRRDLTVGAKHPHNHGELCLVFSHWCVRPSFLRQSLTPWLPISKLWIPRPEGSLETARTIQKTYRGPPPKKRSTRTLHDRSVRNRCVKSQLTSAQNRNGPVVGSPKPHPLEDPGERSTFKIDPVPKILQLRPSVRSKRPCSWRSRRCF